MSARPRRACQRRTAGPGPAGRHGRPRRAGAPAGFAPGAAAAGPAASRFDVTEATFQTEVVERSLTMPVVIDCGSSWCEPCKQLTPVLEKLAARATAAWVLAKVDVEANPRLAQMFRVQGIPTVYRGGRRPAGRRVHRACMPEAQMRQWIDAVLRAAGVEVPERRGPGLLAADDALMSGDLDEAERAYKKILSDTPADEAAEAGLAQVALLRRVAGRGPGRGAGRGRRRSPTTWPPSGSPPTSRSSAARPSAPTRAWSTWSAGSSATTATRSASTSSPCSRWPRRTTPPSRPRRRALASALF